MAKSGICWGWVLACCAICVIHSQYIDNDFRFSSHRQPSHVIVSSKFVRPGLLYRVRVFLFNQTVASIRNDLEVITMLASIQRDGVQIAHAQKECRRGVSETLLLMIPPTSIPGNYKLRVEGNVNGVLGGTAFWNETDLIFSQRSMTIFIQTDKPIYTQGQVVKFRAMPITTELKAFSDAVDVYMLNPNKTIMRRWLSRRTNLGSVSLEYDLSDQPNFGNWTIRVIAQGQVEEKPFLVEEYYQTRFEVNVTMPTYYLLSDQYVHGWVVANYTSGAGVKGNLTIRATLQPLDVTYNIRERHIPSLQQHFEVFEGRQEFKFEMKELRYLASRLEGMKVVVTAYVGERYLEMIQTGFCESILFNSTLKLKFLGSMPQVYKPGMPFRAYVGVTYADGSPLPWTSLVGRQVDEYLRVTVTGGGLVLRQSPHVIHAADFQPHSMKADHYQEDTGLWEIVLEAPSDTVDIATQARVSAEFFDNELGNARGELILYPSFSQTGHYLQVTTSTRHPKVGEFIVLHVRPSYYVQTLHYLVISKGQVLISGEERMESSSTRTLAITLSPEMSPSATCVVFDVTNTGEVVADSLTFPVDGITQDKFVVQLNNRKDKTGDSIEVAIYGDPGTYVALSAVDRTLYEMHAGTEISQHRVLTDMMAFDVGINNGTLRQMWRSHTGDTPHSAQFPASSVGLDTNKTFAFAGLVLFTDAHVPKALVECNASAGFLTCYDGQCVPEYRRCDGYPDCSDGSDESNCEDLYATERKMTNFQLYRRNRYTYLYTNSWLWHDINIGPLGRHIFILPVPDIPTMWQISAFGMTNANGFGILSAPITFSSGKPFYMNVEMPRRIRIGEQLGIRVTVFNYRRYETEVLITLASSPDYKFVHVDPFGKVSSYAPKTSYGEHQHLIFVKAGEQFEVYMPIVPVRIGYMNVTLTAKTQIARDSITKELFVEPDGIPQRRHISMLLDLSEGAYAIRYLDTNLTETPILPFRQDRLYTFGSNRAQVSVFGDVVGPAFPTMPMNATSMLNLPFFCGEQNMFSFGANMWMLLYLRLTGQRDNDLEKKTFKYLNIYYQRQLVFQNPDGSFNVFRHHHSPSTWLTAFCARIFYRSTFQEWEQFFYVDPLVISKAMDWLLTRQASWGAFYEFDLYPYDRKMSPLEVGSRVSTARRSARAYLEKMLNVVERFVDPYELAIVAYALTITNSDNAEDAFDSLDKHMKETSGMRYWSRENLPPPKTVIENNRPYIQPRLPFSYDASNVETTAYALLVHVARQAVIQKEIAMWLNSQRLTHGGWASTQDTLMAIHALIEYTVQSRLRDVADMRIIVEAPSTPGFTRRLTVGKDNLPRLQTLDIPNAWGGIIVTAHGSGLGVLQMHIDYNVDTWPHLVTQPPVTAFDLRVTQFSSGRNSSHIKFTSCQSWMRTDESPASGMAVLEVNIPSGYHIEQQILDAYVFSNTVRNLHEARYSDTKVEMYFDYLDPFPICVNFTLQRWFPIANMTRFIAIKVYDYYAPERFNETMFEVYNLYALSICHVCGSYQCPYCPIFSHGVTTTPATSLALILPLVLAYVWYRATRW